VKPPSTQKFQMNTKESSRKISRPGSAIYFFAFIGALIYYIQHATSFLTGVIGFFKALFWPGFLVYKLLEFLKM
jgi:hypothetical protein